MAKKSPTARTLEWLRKQGYIADVTERWIPHSKVRKDLFGFVDIVAVHPDNPPLFVQTTSASNHAARRKKVLDSLAARWLIQFVDVAIVSWDTGKTTSRIRFENLVMSDFPVAKGAS